MTFLAAATPGAGRFGGALLVPAVSSDSSDRGGRAPWYADVPPDVAAPPLVPLEARAPPDAIPSPAQLYSR